MALRPLGHTQEPLNALSTISVSGPGLRMECQHRTIVVRKCGLGLKASTTDFNAASPPVARCSTAI
jgi:hypothetical protein